MKKRTTEQKLNKTSPRHTLAPGLRTPLVLLVLHVGVQAQNLLGHGCIQQPAGLVKEVLDGEGGVGLLALPRLAHALAQSQVVLVVEPVRK